MERKGYLGKTIGVKLRYDDFKIVTRDQTLESWTADAAAIRQTAGMCLKRVDLSRRMRLLGVRVGTLVKASEMPDLASFSAPAIVKRSLIATESGSQSLPLFSDPVDT